MAKSIEIDRKKRLRDEPSKGHNRWHPDIAPGVRIPNGAFMGTAGVAPSHEQLRRFRRRRAPAREIA